MSTTYHYQARAASGRTQRGAIEAASATQAVARLRARNLTPFTLTPIRRGSAAGKLTEIAARDLTRTLAQFLRAGLSFTQALQFASEDLEGGAAEAATRMREAAERGEPVASALDLLPGAPARLLAGVVRAGESSGKLADALEVAAHAFSRGADLRNRMSSALIYPTFVITATLATLVCFILFVVPTMTSAFAGMEDRLPASTRALIGLSEWLKRNGVVALIGPIATLSLVLSNAVARARATRWRDALLASPLGLGISPRLDYATFASLAALSLRAGVAPTHAFEAAANAVRNIYIREQLERAIAEIRTGERPSTAFARSTAAPRAFLQLAIVGEETGKLGDTLAQAGALLSSEAEQRLERMGALSGPVITLVLGALVAAVVMSLFAGLLSMSELATL